MKSVPVPWALPHRHGRAFCKTPLLLPPPPHLRYEQHGRGDEQEQEPVGDAKGRDAEHAAAEGDDNDLPCENERGNQQETTGGGNVREGGAVGGEGAGVVVRQQLVCRRLMVLRHRHIC